MDSKKGVCPNCDGTCIDPNKPSETCPDCGGTGWIEIYPESSIKK